MMKRNLTPKSNNWHTLILNSNGSNSNGKKSQLINLIDSIQSNAIIMSETKLSKDIHNSEVLPPGYLENKSLRCDRNINGGGIISCER